MNASASKVSTGLASLLLRNNEGAHQDGEEDLTPGRATHACRGLAAELIHHC